jgi:hypothetical protein
MISSEGKALETMSTEAARLADSLRGSGTVVDGRMMDLKRGTDRGALISIGGQAAIFVTRTGSMVILAGLVSPMAIGLFGVVSSCLRPLIWAFVSVAAAFCRLTAPSHVLM